MSVLYQQNSDISTITLNRPERLNAIDRPMLEELISCLKTATEDDSSVIIIKGAGRTFCCGADLKEMKERTAAEWNQIVSRYLVPLRQIIELPKPVICHLNGDAVGGGFGIALACDFRLMSENARFSAPFVNIGMAGCDMGVSYFLPRMVPLGLAKELLMTGRFIDAQEVLAVGLVNRIEQSENLENVVEKFARSLTQKSSNALSWTKRAIAISLDADLREEFNFEVYAQVQCLQSNDCKERVNAFLKKSSAKIGESSNG